jgi:hypothetical protein
VRILALAGDPGGAEAIAPVISALKYDPCYDVEVYSYRQATAIFARHSLAPKVIFESESTADFKRLLTEQQIEVVLCATSVNGVDFETLLVLAAKQCGVASISVVDFWSNYRRRYLNASKTELILPDKIAVPDERAKSQMIFHGFPPDKIVVTGQPALDRLADIETARLETAAVRLRDDLRFDAKTVVVIFASQPLSEFYGGEKNCRSTLGYTELTVFELVQDAVEIVEKSLSHIRVKLIVQSHPRENVDAWKRLEIEQRSFVVNPLPVTSFDVCIGADIVIGMTSMLLLEIRCLGKQVLSVEPGTASPLYQNFSEVDVFTSEDASALASVISRKLQNPRLSRIDHAAATQRVVEELSSLCLNSQRGLERFTNE